MQTVTRTIGNQDAARIKAALHGAVRFATQPDGDAITFIFLAEEAQAAAEIISRELSR